MVSYECGIIKIKENPRGFWKQIRMNDQFVCRTIANTNFSVILIEVIAKSVPAVSSVCVYLPV